MLEFPRHQDHWFGAAPRAGVQAPDQRFLVPGVVGEPSFSGVFLGACSACPMHAESIAADRHRLDHPDRTGQLRLPRASPPAQPGRWPDFERDLHLRRLPPGAPTR